MYTFEQMKCLLNCTPCIANKIYKIPNCINLRNNPSSLTEYVLIYVDSCECTCLSVVNIIVLFFSVLISLCSKRKMFSACARVDSISFFLSVLYTCKNRIHCESVANTFCDCNELERDRNYTVSLRSGHEVLNIHGINIDRKCNFFKDY